MVLVRWLSWKLKERKGLTALPANMNTLTSVKATRMEMLVWDKHPFPGEQCGEPECKVDGKSWKTALISCGPLWGRLSPYGEFNITMQNITSNN